MTVKLSTHSGSYGANGGGGARPLTRACAHKHTQPRPHADSAIYTAPPPTTWLNVRSSLGTRTLVSPCMSFLPGRGSMSLSGQPPGAARCPAEACCMDGGGGIKVVVTPL